ncbi:MAG: helix-turn-helix transcriptional regulator [Actinobacteria bacterium]|nr:helix-turn-helix transcriptional regulator [Actinomycetota bacterium]
MTAPRESWLARPLGLLQKASGVPVAPRVAARLSAYARDDDDALRLLAQVLTPAQLAGRTILPDPLPAIVDPPADDAGSTPLSAAQQRVLLHAALSVTESIADVLEASAVDIDVLLFGRLQDLLQVRAGTVRFLDERVRAAVIHAASPHGVRQTHAALGRACARRGARDGAAWHGALGGPAGARGRHAAPLCDAAQSLLARGASERSLRFALLAVSRGAGSGRARALALAGRAAFWCGYLEQAQSLLERALPGLPADAASFATAALRATHLFLEDRSAQQSEFSHQRSIDVTDALRDANDNPVDLAAIDLMARISALLYVDPAEADALQAQLYLTVAGTARDADREPEFASPMVEAHVLVMTVGFQVNPRDFHGAGRVLLDAIPRLPLEHVGAGIVSDLVRMTAAEVPQLGEDIAAAFERIRPRWRLTFDTSAPRTGERSAAALGTGAAPEPHPGASDLLQNLTPRQREVAELVQHGLTNREIGARLHVSERTIEVHLGAVFRTIGVRSRTGLMAALSQGRLAG